MRDVSHTVKGFMLGALVALTTLFVGCKWVKSQGEKAQAEERKRKESLVSTARNVLTDPRNWKQQGEHLVAFEEAAAALGWSKTNAVVQFKADALNLFQFALPWVEKLDEEKLKQFEESNLKIMGKAQVSGGVDGGAAAQQVNAQVGKSAAINIDATKAASAVKSLQNISSNKLTPEQAKELTALFASALNSFGVLCNLAK